MKDLNLEKHTGELVLDFLLDFDDIAAMVPDVALYKKQLISLFDVYNIEKMDKSSLLEQLEQCSLANKIKERLKQLICLARRIIEDPDRKGRRVIRLPGDIYEVFSSLQFEDNEFLKCAYLNIRNELLFTRSISIGAYNMIQCTPSDIFIPAIRQNARNIILAHNHPSGDCAPSEDDLGFTARVKKGGDLLGVTLLDHVIIGRNNYFSFKKEDLI